MTDKEKLLSVLNDFGIVALNQEGLLKEGYSLDTHDFVVLKANKGNVEGYNGFYCQFAFTKEGKFLEAGVWE